MDELFIKEHNMQIIVKFINDLSCIESDNVELSYDIFISVILNSHNRFIHYYK